MRFLTREADDNSPDRRSLSCDSMTAVRPTSCTTWCSSSSCKASKAPAMGALGAKSPPIASNAIRAKLCFLRFYSLFAVVVSALCTDMMRPPHGLAAGTLLNDDGRRDLVRVARALLSFGGASLRDSHWFYSLRFVDELVRVALMLEQSVPARVSCGRRAVARAFVEVRTASGAQSLAVFAALNVCGSRK